LLSPFHRDLIDVRECPGSRRTFNSPHRDFLHLVLGIVHLLLHLGDLRILPSHNLFQRLDPQFRDPPLRFPVFFQERSLLIRLLLSVLDRLRCSLVHLPLQPIRKIGRVLPQTREFLLLLP